MEKIGGKWLGKSLKRFEDRRLLAGRGTFVDDIKVPRMHYAAVLRSPHAHARIKRMDASRAMAIPGVIGVLTGEDVAAMSDPFSVGVKPPIKYYSLAVDKARFVGEPVAVVVAKDRYIAEDAMAEIDVEYEPLPAVTDPEKAMEPGAPILHEAAGTNVANHRLLRYGDVDGAFSKADFTVKVRLSFPKYSSTPMETYAVTASYDPITEVMTVWCNFQGPFVMHPLIAKAIRVEENRLRFIVPADIGGGFGIKTSMFPYIALIALASKKTGAAVKWIEDRREHLLASSSGTDRIAYLEAAVKKDGDIIGLKAKYIDNVGGYIRAPDPGCLYRSAGNWVGSYKFQNLEVDGYAVMTNKSLTGPNRGYGCQQLYFGLERLMDKIAEKAGLDPAEIRMRNFIEADKFPYTTPTGGIYDSGDYPKTMSKTLEMAGYENLKKRRDEARRQGKLFGIGIAAAVDPSVSNLGYVTMAFTPEERSRKGYMDKSGSGETGMVTIGPLGKITATVNTTPEGQGHETVVAQIVASELGADPSDVNVVAEMDTFTRYWGIATGSYSSRFASAGASAVAIAARKVKEKMLKIAAHQLEVSVDELDLADEMVFVKGSPDRSISAKHIAGIAHWNPKALPEGMEPGLGATYVFNFPTSAPPNSQDMVDSSNTYGFVVELMAIEIDPSTCQVDIKKYVSVHDAGTLLNPLIVEGQIYGSALHGLAGALYEEMVYDENGQPLAATFQDYLCPTSVESPKIDVGHVISPSPFTVLGSKGCGESSSETAPVVVANAVADALSPLGVDIVELPLSPDKIWRLLKAAGNPKGA